MFASGRMTELYMVPVAGGKSRQVLGTPAQMPVFSKDGTKMFYHDVKGFEDEWRKHHTSSVSRDVWMYDPATGKHTNVTNRPGEDRNPVLSADGNTLYILSERDGGTFNVWAFPVASPASARPLTDFTTHPVRFLSRADNGVMAFAYDGEIYTMASDNAKPVKVPVDIVADGDASVMTMNVKPAGAVVSPDGKSVAFISRGDVFVTSVEYPTTVQVTDTPAAERHLSWGDDNRTLYYTSERSGHKNIYRATLGRKDDPNFANATAIKEEAMFDVKRGEKLTDATAEYSHPVVSPDGKQMAFVSNRNEINVMDLATRAVRRLTDGSTYPGQDDEMVMVWSPDSRWLATELMPAMHDPYADIALVEVATGKVTNITQSGYFCSNPRFVLDGNAILFFTDRYGMRNHASWGSQEDIMIVFLNREARDRFMLSEEDFALLEEAEKAEKKVKEGEKGDAKKGKKGKDADKADKKEDKAVKVELDGIETRIMRLTPYSSDLSDAIVTADGETLYYLCSFEDGYDLWKLPLRKREPKLVSKTNTHNRVRLQADKDGKGIFLMGPKMQKLDPKSDKLTAVAVSATQKVDAAAEREAMFDHMAVEEGARFYKKDMHGVDWPAMTEAYRRFLPHINNGYDFADLLSELLGELNVSHSGGRYYPDGAKDQTASLGLLFDMSDNGSVAKVDEIVEGGPFDRATTKVRPGDIVEAINGEKTADAGDWETLLNNTANKKTLISLYRPSSGERWEEVVLPVRTSVMSELLYNRWVKGREHAVDSLSGGRLGYLHLRSMDDESFREIYSKLLGKYYNKEGIVIDTRWNGGGRLHEDIEVLFSGDKYLTQEVHGRPTGEMPSRRWNKPSVMIIGEANYSNAHGTPWVYKYKNLGKLVGMPVPGTMSSVNWITLQNPDLLFGVPVVAFRTAEGNVLENTQLEPDIKVANHPADIVKGIDAQLEAAVKSLLGDIDKKK